MLREVGNPKQIAHIGGYKSHTSEHLFQNLLSIMKDYVFKAWQAKKSISIVVTIHEDPDPKFDCKIEEW